MLKLLSSNREENESLEMKYGQHEHGCKNENTIILQNKDTNKGVNGIGINKKIFQNLCNFI